MFCVYGKYLMLPWRPDWISFVHFFWCMVICEYRTESNPLVTPLLVFGLKIKNGHHLMFHSFIPTYVEYVCNSKHLASSVKWKTHRILVREWEMKLGIAPLQSAWKNLSNDVLKVDFNVGHVFAKNGTQAKAINIYNPWFFMILGQNSTYSKMDIVWTLHSCWSQ